MNYLYGDSTESGLDFNYLAFLREAIDCCAVLVECDAVLALAGDRKLARQKEATAAIRAIEEFGKRSLEHAEPIAKAEGQTALGRAASSVVAAVKEAIERESVSVRGLLTGDIAQLDTDDQRLRARCAGVVARLLKAHDLPGASRGFEIAWSGTAYKAGMRQKTGFGVEAVLDLDIPPASVFAHDLKVERLADGVEVLSLAAGGWLKKGDKLVSHKLAKHHVTRVVIGDADIAIRLRSGSEAGATTIDLVVARSGDVKAEWVGGNGGRELATDERTRPGIQLLADKLEAAAESLAEHRGTDVTCDIDGKSIADHPRPRVLAERLIGAMAPVVAAINKHSRSPGELVLRRLLGGDRREEVFVSIAELASRIDNLPAEGKRVFVPLGIVEGDVLPPVDAAQPAAPAPAAAPRTAPPTAPPKSSRSGTADLDPSMMEELDAPPVVVRSKSPTHPPNVELRPPEPPRVKSPTIPSGPPPPIAGAAIDARPRSPTNPSLPRPRTPTQPSGPTAAGSAAKLGAFGSDEPTANSEAHRHKTASLADAIDSALDAVEAPDAKDGPR